MPFCSKCGREIEGADKYCNSCGQAAVDSSGQAAKKRQVKYVCLVLGVLIPLVWGVWGTSGFAEEFSNLGYYLTVPGGLVGFAIGAIIDQYSSK